MSKRLFVAAVLCTLFLPAALFAQQVSAPADHGRILGGVITTTGPLIAADVTLRNAADSTVARVVTGPDGRFLIDNVAFATYTLQVSFVGYRPRIFEGVVVSKATPLADLGIISLDAALIAQEGRQDKK